MVERCSATVVGGRQCSRKAVERGKCKQHLYPIMYELAEEKLFPRLEGIHCPCEWGNVTSPAHSHCDDDTLAVVCIDCRTTTGEMPLTEEAHIQPIIDAWIAACAARKIEIEAGNG